MDELYCKREVYSIIGLCMEVHKILGKGHNEIIYGDALEYEFVKNSIPFEREKCFRITYKDYILPHFYFSDFVLFENLILEIKAIQQISSGEIKQTLNYLAASKNKLGCSLISGVTVYNTKELSYKFVQSVKFVFKFAEP